MGKFNNVLKEIRAFTKAEKRMLAKQILAQTEIGSITDLRSGIIGKQPDCPYCNSESVKKNGSHLGKQRYVCLEIRCKKGFRAMTGTFAHGMHHIDKIPRYVELMIESKSLRVISKELDIGLQTAFDWRHKILSSISASFTKKFRGIVELDDIPLGFNQKGGFPESGDFINSLRHTNTWTNQYGKRISRKHKPNVKRKRGTSNDKINIIMAMDRYGSIGAIPLRRGRITLKSLYRLFNGSFGERFSNTNIVVTDKSSAYIKVLKSKGLSHERIQPKVGLRVRKRFHLNTLNNTDGRYKGWVEYYFFSVGTKYITNYLAYFMMLHFTLKECDEKAEDFLKLALADTKAYSRMKSIEESYQEFLTY